jgi:hypothetical protein
VLTTLHGTNVGRYETLHMTSDGRSWRPGTNLQVKKREGGLSRLTEALLASREGRYMFRLLIKPLSGYAVINMFKVQNTIKMQGLSLVLQTRMQKVSTTFVSGRFSAQMFIPSRQTQKAAFYAYSLSV